MSSLQSTIQNTITEEDLQRSTELIRMGSNKSFIENNFGSSVQIDNHTQQTDRTDITSQACDQEAVVDEDNRLFRNENANAMNTPAARSLARSERGSSSLGGPIISAQRLYRFEWFRLLIAQVLFASSGIALTIVVLFTLLPPSPEVVKNIATAFTSFLGLPLLWAFPCLCSQLTIACQRAYNSASTDSHIRRQNLYRTLWYTWFICITTSIPVTLILATIWIWVFNK